MHNRVGLWIDHQKAFIVFVGEHAQLIESGLEKHVRFSGRAYEAEGVAEDQRDRQYQKHLNDYYDNVITKIHDARFVYIFGPGEAKDELKSRLAHQHLDDKVVDIEAADKMTLNQIEEKTEKYFHH